MKTVSLRQRLVRLQTALVAIVLLVSFLFISFSDFHIFKKLALQKYETTAKILSRNLVTCLSFKDQDECSRVLSTLLSEESIVEAIIVDASKNKFADFKSPVYLDGPKIDFSNPANNYQYSVENSYLVASYPILENGHIEGHLFLLAKLDMIKVFGSQHAFVFLIAMMGAICIAILLAGQLQKDISGQMRVLLKAMLHIRKDKAYNLRITTEPNWNKVNVKEFKELGDSFDSMIEQVENRDKAMKEQNENLEKIIEEKVQEVLRTAELASLGEMAGGIAHEINNPLTIISSTNRVLSMMIAKDKIDTNTFQELIKTSDQTVTRIAKIVTGLRNLSRSSGDKDISDCNFQDVFNDVLEVAESKFKSKGIEIKKQYSEDEASLIFRANRIQLSQVLINLLNNSYDELQSNNYFDKWVKIEIKASENILELRISDAGSGIPQKVRDKMFNPFFTTKEIGKGTGLGLPLSKSMVEKMGGKFFYEESSPNTCFIVQLSRIPNVAGKAS